MNFEKKIKFDVFGVCCSRDIFGLSPNDKFEVGKYFQLSFIPQFDTSPLFDISPLKPEEFLKNTKFELKQTAAELNRTVLSDLSKSGAEWIIVDLRQLAYGLKRLEFGGEVHYASDRLITKNNIEKAITAKEMELNQCAHIDIEELPNAEDYLNQFCDFLKLRYGKNIILVELKEALWHLDKEGNVTYDENPQVEYYGRVMDEWFIKTLDKLDCYYIRTPMNILCDDHHAWGRETVHYIQEWYDYANKCVDLITSKDPEYQKKMDRLNIELANFFDNVRGKNILSRRNTWRRFEEDLKKASSKEEIDAVIKKSIENSNRYDNLTKGEIFGRIARAYRDRKDGNADLNKSVEYMREAKDLGCKFAPQELFDLLWVINTPKSLLEMINLAYCTTANGKNAEMIGRMGRVYRDGKGLSKNLNESAKWMKQSADLGCNWAKWEYIDILRMINTPETDTKALEYANSVLSVGREIYARLGRIYRDGRGVEKNLNAAAEWMRKSSDLGLGWAQIELFDILWELNTPESLKEMIVLAEPLAKANNGPMQGRMGRAYREGKGVERNLKKASEWMKKASEQKVAWAPKELAEINLSLRRNNI